MSGICGIVALDGSEPSPREIEAMTAPLDQRGPDGTHHWLGGQAALGHTLLATTPEALTEVMPLTDPASGCTITADVRLDNREELIPALGLEDETRVIGDGELILRAYLLWGEACLDHLLGDFAFAIWDPRAGRLFCGRDHMGMRQLIYCHVPGKLFVFATEPRAILTHEGVPHRLNEGRIAEYLDGLEAVDFTSTFFEEIYRLPPAHSLTVDADGLRIERYWELVPGPELKLGSDEAYAEAFLEVFTEAVRCRLRSASPVGSMLSGGTDSTSVAAMASELLAADGRGPLHTFSAVGPDPETCIETRTIHAAQALSNISPHQISHADLGEYLDDLIELTRDAGEPFDGYMTLVRSVYLLAHRAGMKVVLDGVAGDIALIAGRNVIYHLRHGNFRRAWREAASEQQFWGRAWPARKTFLRGLWHAFLPVSVRDHGRRLRLQQKYRIRDKRSFISPAFAHRVDLSARRKRYDKPTPPDSMSDAEVRARSILGRHLVAGRERYDRVASALAIEPRDPFLDIRILKFSLSLPWTQLQEDGWPKIILRRAMKGRLPDTVLWRKGKQHLGSPFTEALFSIWAGWRSQLGNAETTLNPYMKAGWLHSVPDGDMGDDDLEKLLDVIHLASYVNHLNLT